MKNNIMEQVTGVNFKSEYEEEINKITYYKIKKWLEHQIFKAKKCIQKIQQVCEVYFEPQKTRLGQEQFYISICQGEDGLVFLLKKRIVVENAVNERFSKISKGQFSSFVNGSFDENESDDLVFEFCQKARIEELKASYSCHFEREEYIFKRSNVYLTIDKNMEIQPLGKHKALPFKKKGCRMRLKSYGSENEFNSMKTRLLTVCG